MSQKRKGGRTTPAARALPLVLATDPVLHGVAMTAEPSEMLFQLGQRMIATAWKYNGMAVAAPQVGADVRLVALHTGLVVLNPTIHDTSGQQIGDEGCLTYPDRWWRVPRAFKVYVTGVDVRDGKAIGTWADAVDARMWQHEIDHLDGLVLVNRFDEVTEEHNAARR